MCFIRVQCTTQCAMQARTWSNIAALGQFQLRTIAGHD
jgi:hypothetical protein